MTQKEIAARLQISQATVSLALKDSEKISAELRHAVRKLAVDTGYRPNLAGQMLRQGRSNVVGVLFPSLRNLFYSELYQTLQEQLMPHGYLLCLVRAEGTAEHLAEAVETLRRMRVCAVIATGVMAGPLMELRQRGTPVIVYGGDGKLELPVSQVLPDRLRGGFELTDFLIRRRGCRRIAFLGSAGVAELRYRGYLAALEKAGLEYCEARVVETGPDDDGYTMMRRLLTRGIDFDAVFCHNDETAIGAMRAAVEAGKRIPRDFSLVGFDNIALGAYLNPSLTTMEQPLRPIAEALIAELLATAADPAFYRFHSIPCRLIERES